MQLSVLTDEETFGPQGDGLINTYSFTDDGGFTNDHAGSVIDKESVINLRTGMNIDSGLAMRLFRDDARQQRKVELMQLMGQPIVHHRMNSRVAEQHIIHAARGGVTLISGEDITVKTLTNHR